MRKNFFITLIFSLCLIFFVILVACNSTSNTIKDITREISTSSVQLAQSTVSFLDTIETSTLTSSNPNSNSTSLNIFTSSIPEENKLNSSLMPDEREGAEMLSNSINIEIGENKFTAKLEDNPSAESFKSMLPMTIKMGDLNDNEKYSYLLTSLPTNSQNFGSVKNGDIMLYGSDCLVLFYEGFSTSYSYTKLGVVDNPSRLAEILGSGSVMVTWSLA